MVPQSGRSDPQTGNHRFLDVVGGGTLFDAIYAAVLKDRQNENVRLILEQGVGNVIILRKETPESELRWCKSVHTAVL